METVTPLHIYLAVAVVFLLAGIVKGVIGLGLPTMAMGLLTLMMSPADAVTLLVIPALITNLWQSFPVQHIKPLWRHIGPMQYCIFIGTVASILVLGAPAGIWSQVILGLALMAYAAWGMCGAAPVLGTAVQTWLGPAAGIVTGIITSLTGVSTIPSVPYLQALQLPRDRFIQAMGLSFTVSTCALGLGLWMTGSYSLGAAGMSFVMLLPVLAGMFIGQQLRNYLSPAVFKRCFFIGLAVLGVYQLLKSVM